MVEKIDLNGIYAYRFGNTFLREKHQEASLPIHCIMSKSELARTAICAEAVF